MHENFDAHILHDGESAETIGHAIGSPPRGRIGKLNPVIAKAIRENWEAKQRREHAEREANRTGQAQKARYIRHILSCLPVMNGVQRIPTSEINFWDLVGKAYNTISHEKGYRDFWMDARAEVWKLVRNNQVIVATAYAAEMRKAMATGSTNLKAIWNEIAHYSDKDDANLKRHVWKILSE